MATKTNTSICDDFKKVMTSQSVCLFWTLITNPCYPSNRPYDCHTGYLDRRAMDSRLVETVSAPTNIAVIKYWGKGNVELNTPLNSSVSCTLDQVSWIIPPSYPMQYFMPESLPSLML